MNFSEKIWRLRREKGISQEELADLCDVSRQAISKWESAQAMPETDKLLRISKTFHVSIDYLLNEEIHEKCTLQENYTYSFEKICNLLLPRRESMETLYENAKLYDVIYDEKRDESAYHYWNTVLGECREKIKTVLDCSIGTGQMSLALAQMGYELSGSDISQEMLEQCKQNARQRNLSVNLTCCDFRQLTGYFHAKYDLVASTGNSLPHVENTDVAKTLQEMDALVKPGGYLYLDIRNWDKILREHQRFFFYQPWFVHDERINLTMVWDYNLDGTITFNLLYSFEKDGKIYKKDISSVYYYPIARQFLEDEITRLGYHIISESPQNPGDKNIEDCDWYYILAQK